MMDSGDDASHTVPSLYADYVFFNIPLDGSMLLSFNWLCLVVPMVCPVTRSVFLLRARWRHGDTECVFAVDTVGTYGWRQSFTIGTDPFLSNCTEQEGSDQRHQRNLHFCAFQRCVPDVVSIYYFLVGSILFAQELRPKIET